MPVLFTLLTLLLVTITVLSMTAVPATTHSGGVHPDEEHENDDPEPVVLQKVAHDSSSLPCVAAFRSRYVKETIAPFLGTSAFHFSFSRITVANASLAGGSP